MISSIYFPSLAFRIPTLHKNFHAARWLLALLAATLLLSSCKKEASDGSPNSYYLKYKENGSWRTWKKAVGELGVNLADDRQTVFGLTANSDAETDVFDITIAVDGPSLGTGTYDSDTHFVSVALIKNGTSPAITGYTMGSVSGQPDSRYVITLTSITDKVIKRHFTGNYLVNSDDEMLSITEGEFVVPRVR